ncbi:MAG TPA: thioredoxin family protein [Thermoanaerobaculia bacterium]|jgi:alkyl hydroperoxide reductase subunit AhpC
MKKLGMMALLLVSIAGTACAQELALGAKAPAFSLVNAVNGETVTMKPDDGNIKVVVFTCNSCPFAKAFEPRIIELANKFAQNGVKLYAVNPNDDAQYADETLANMKSRAEQRNYRFPYLKDADSKIARAYGARVTPHVFVVDGKGLVRYRGYVDDSAKTAERKTTGLSDAVGALMNGRDVTNAETRAFGCTIKWAGGA